MLLINDKGNIIGYNKTIDTKPAPFVSKTATWTGSDWQYNDTKEFVPEFFNMNAIDCFQLHSYIMSLISPEPGIKVKEKSKDITVLIPSFGYQQQGTTEQINIITKKEQKSLKTALKTASGFGGSNSAMILVKNVEYVRN